MIEEERSDMTREWTPICREQIGSSKTDTAMLSVHGGTLYRTITSNDDDLSRSVALCFVPLSEERDQAHRAHEREEYADWRDEQRAEAQAKKADQKANLTLFPGPGGSKSEERP